MEPDSKFKFVDDLTTLEKINILLIGLTSFNAKLEVPNDINKTNLFIPSQNLKSQDFINQIQRWTENLKMELNAKKTKAMIFNFTKKKTILHQVKIRKQKH